MMLIIMRRTFLSMRHRGVALVGAIALWMGGWRKEGASVVAFETTYQSMSSSRIFSRYRQDRTAIAGGSCAPLERRGTSHCSVRRRIRRIRYAEARLFGDSSSLDEEEKVNTQENTILDSTNNNPRTRGLFLKRYTGDSTPYQFPVRPIRLVKEWPPGPPPFSAEDVSRMDPTTDKAFYALPRLLYHIDEPAVAALTQFYRQNIAPGSDLLDICSSWVSHYPSEFPAVMGKICATGMSGLELQCNDQLTGGYRVADLNGSPVLPYDDNTFDVVTCVVSIDYLIYPVEVLKEVHRVLRPGGSVIVSQSNRCFPTKAVQMWLQMNDRQRLELINGYFHYAGGFVEPRQAYDITADVPGGGYRDPMCVVVAVKASETGTGPTSSGTSDD